MANKIRWGFLSTADIARRKVIPAMKKGTLVEVSAIASRDIEKARAAAKELSIPKAYGSYEELLADKDIDAVYIGLPNHLHVPWAVKAVQAGKHVLCEKPLSTSVKEVRRLMKARDEAGVKVGEAFMVHTHPQWEKAREIIHSDLFGQLKAVQGFFSYNFTDPKNIRNIREYGGGGMLDIGVYPVHTTRFSSGSEPKRVAAIVEYDPAMKIDRLDSVLMDFGGFHAVFTVSTQIVPYQRMQFFGTKLRLEVEIPFNAFPDRPMRLFLDTNDLSGTPPEVIELTVCDQYTVQGDRFSEAVINNKEVPVPLEDSVKNLAVIEAIFTAAKTGRFVSVRG